MIAGTVSVPLRYPVADRLGRGRVAAEPRWSDRRARPAAVRRDAVRSADVSTDPGWAWRAAVPPPDCRSADGRRSGRAASRRRGDRVSARAAPGRAAAGGRAADCGPRGVAAGRDDGAAAPRAGPPPDLVARRESSRWRAGPARAQRDVAGEPAADSAALRMDRRDRPAPAGGVVRRRAAAPDPAGVARVPGAGRPVRRGVARRPRDAGPSAHCPPGRPDPGPSAARGRRAAPAVVADETPAPRPFRGTLPRDTAPTVRDLRALMIARADRHPLMNLAFPQLTADATVIERLRGIPQ